MSVHESLKKKGGSVRLLVEALSRRRVTYGTVAPPSVSAFTKTFQSISQSHRLSLDDVTKTSLSVRTILFIWVRV